MNNKREILLNIGERLFARYGYRDVSIGDITRGAGLATGSFYNYFQSKDAYYSKIIDRIEERGIKEADRLVSSLQSPLNRLKALYHFTTLGIKKNQILRGILTGDEKYIFPGAEERQSRESNLRSHIEKLISDIIREGTKNRIFRSRIYRNPRLLLVALYDTILAYFDSDEINELIHDILLLIERGLKRRLRLRKKDERSDRQLSPVFTRGKLLG